MNGTKKPLQFPRPYNLESLDEEYRPLFLDILRAVTSAAKRDQRSGPVFPHRNEVGEVPEELRSEQEKWDRDYFYDFVGTHPNSKKGAFKAAFPIKTFFSYSTWTQMRVNGLPDVRRAEQVFCLSAFLNKQNITSRLASYLRSCPEEGKYLYGTRNHGKLADALLKADSSESGSVKTDINLYSWLKERNNKKPCEIQLDMEHQLQLRRFTADDIELRFPVGGRLSVMIRSVWETHPRELFCLLVELGSDNQWQLLNAVPQFEIPIQSPLPQLPDPEGIVCRLPVQLPLCEPTGRFQFFAVLADKPFPSSVREIVLSAEATEGLVSHEVMVHLPKLLDPLDETMVGVIRYEVF